MLHGIARYCKVTASVLEKQTIDRFCVLFMHLPHASQANVRSSVVTSSVTSKQCTLIFCNTNQHVLLVGRTRSGSSLSRLASIVYMVCGECCHAVVRPAPFSTLRENGSGEL